MQGGKTSRPQRAVDVSRRANLLVPYGGRCFSGQLCGCQRRSLASCDRVEALLHWASTVCDPHALVNRLESRKDESQRAEEANAKANVARGCKQPSCKKAFRSSLLWHVCACKQFRMCPKCFKQPDFARLFHTHTESCTPAEPSPQKSRTEEPDVFE